jgi:hypothetical protein
MSIRSITRRDSVAFAFLIAMGLAVALTTGAAFSGIAGGAVQDLLHTAGIGRDDAVKAEQQRQAAALAHMERSLDILRGEVGRLAVQANDAAEAAAATEIQRRAAQAEAAETDKPKSSASDIDVAALRTSIDEHDERSRAALAAVNKRVDWLETLVYARDATATVTPATPAAPAAPAKRRGGRASEQSAPRWLVLHAENGVAVISGKGGTIDVTPGYVIPELGRVSAIRQQDGHWQVVTEKTTISQR